MPTYYGVANNGKQLRLDISWTQNAAGNYSDVRSVLYLINNQWVSDSNMQVGNVIDGVQVYFWQGSASYDAGTLVLADNTHRVTHNSSGNRSVSFAAAVVAVNTGFVNVGITVNNLTLPSITQPPLSPYAPPSLSASRVNNSRVDLSWTTRYTDAAGRYPWSGVRLQRWSKRTGNWSTIATLSPTVTSYRDTGVSADNEYQYRIQSYNSAGNSGWTSASGSIKMTPAAPSSVTASLSGANATVAWTNNALSQSGFYIDRWSKSSNTWTRVAAVGSGVRSWTDTNIPLNNQYKYRVSAYIGSLLSTWVETTAFNTKPSAPTTVTAEKTGLNIIVKWSNTAVSQTGAIIYDNGVQVGTVGVGVSEFTHASPNGTITHTYTVRATVSPPSLQSDLSTPSNTVLLVGIPNAPADLKTSRQVYSAEDDLAFLISWRHNPVDSSTQTAYQLRYRKSGAGWTTLAKVDSSTQSASILFSALAGTIEGEYEFQVMTWGAHASGSPYSASATSAIESNPLITIIGPPAGEVINTNRVTLEWTYSQAQARPQSTYNISLFQGDSVVYSTSLASTATSVDIPYTLLDNSEYVFELEVIASNGLSSGIQALAFGVAYAKPASPVLDGYFNEDAGAHMMSFVNPEGDIETLFNRVYRNVDKSSDWYGLENNQTPPMPDINYFDNPKFERTTGSVMVRRNAIRYPSLKGVSTGWAAHSSLARTDSPAGLILSSTAPILAASLLYRSSNTEQTASAGEYWSGAMEVENITPADITLRLQQYWVGSNTFSTPVDIVIPASTKQRITVSAIAPTGTTHVRLTLSTASVEFPAGAAIRVSEVINERGRVAGPYFDGYGQSVPDSDFATSWSGAEGNSASLLTGMAIAGVTTSNCMAIQSTKHAQPGNYSMRLIPAHDTNNASWAEFSVPVPVRPGGVFMANRHQDATLTGTLLPYGLATILPGDASGYVNAAGSTNIRLPYGALTSLYTAYFYHGGISGSGDVYWSEAGIYPASYNGSYFDGDMGISIQEGMVATASWQGDPNDSASIITYDYPLFDATEWEYMGEFPLNASFSDYEGLTNGRTMYMVEAVSEIPSSARGFFSVDVDSRWVWLSKYDGSGNAGAIPYNLSTTDGYVHPQSSVHHFDGRSKPVLISGDALDHTIQVTGTLDPTEHRGSSYEDLVRVATDPGPHIYRDKNGNRFFAKIDSFSSAETRRLRQVSFTVIEVERYGI